MKHIGRVFEYVTHQGDTRKATCKKLEFHAGLGKPIFIGISPYGHEVKLTKEEIHRFL